MSDSSLKIYCRIRPLDDPKDFNCVVQRDENTISFVPFEGSLISKKSKEICYTFEHLFNDGNIQKEIFDYVAYPLVHKLLQGKDGLILTHGLSSSGKTYTMTGTPDDEGLIPRSLDVIFNTIVDCQAPKFLFKSNKQNGFVLQSTPEALIDQQNNMGLFSKTTTPKRTGSSLGEWSDRVSDSYIVNSVSYHQKYAVFITYLEIYNNYIYDLLEDVPEERKFKNCSSKMLHEDLNHNMYVLGAVESEVKTADEALELFCKGQLRRKFSNTSVNACSSRSHTVFTIRLVQAPFSPDELVQSQNEIVVSQLSFVDLASCERIAEIKNGTQKLYEAGSKNATLNALSSCIEALKKSQNGKEPKTVPYSKSKLTHLFKSFFKGKGEVRMIICLNPRLDDCIKTAKFLKFAKATGTSQSDISEISRKSDRKQSCRGKSAIEKAMQQGVKMTEMLETDTDIELPKVTTTFDDESSYTSLIEDLKKRKMKRLSLEKDLISRQNEFRNNLISIEKENNHLKEDKKLLELDLRGREQQVHGLEQQLCSAEEMIEMLDKDMVKMRKQLEEIRIEVQSKDQIIANQAKEIENAKARMKEKLASEKRRYKQTMERRLATKRAEIERKMCFDAARFRQLREILNSDDSTNWEDLNLDVELSTETSSSATYTIPEAISDKDSHRLNGKKTDSRKGKSFYKESIPDIQPVSKLKKTSQLDKPGRDSHVDFADLITSQSLDTVQSDVTTNRNSRTSVKKFFTRHQNITTDPHSVPSPIRSNQNSRTSIKKLFTKQQSINNHPPAINNHQSIYNNHQATTADPQPVRRNESKNVFQYLAGGCCSMFKKTDRHSGKKSDSDCVWIEHRPIGNLEINDYVPPISKKRTVSFLSTKDIIKTKASHYVLQHQEINDGEMAVELYKAEIIPTVGGGAKVEFKDIVKMVKMIPRNQQLNESVPLQEVEERCAIAIECRGVTSKIQKKK